MSRFKPDTKKSKVWTDRPLSLWLSTEIYDRLKAAADASGNSVSGLGRQMLTYCLDDMETDEHVPASEL